MAQNYFIDFINGNDSNSGSELNPWKTGDKVSTLSDATPFHFTDDTLYLKAGQYHVMKKIRLKKQGSSGGWLTIDRYGEGPDPILVSVSNDDALPGGVISIDSCYKVKIKNVKIDAGYQFLISCVGQKHATDTSLVHALDIENCVALNAGQDGFAFHYGALTESPVASIISNSKAIKCMDNGVGLYGFSNGFTVKSVLCQDIGNVSAGVPDYGEFGGDGISFHDTARNTKILFCTLERCRDGIHNINLGIPGGVIVGSLFIDNTKSAIKLMDYSAAAATDAQGFALFGNSFVLPSGMSGNGGLIFGRDGDDAPGTGVEVGVGGIFSASMWNNTFYNLSSKPSVFASWKNNALNDSAIFDHANNLYVAAGASAKHIQLVRRARTITFTNGINAYSSAASGKFVLDGVDKTLAEMISANVEAATSFSNSELGLLGDPSTNIYRSILKKSSPCIGVGKNLAVAAAAQSVDAYDFMKRLYRANSRWDIGGAMFATGPTRNLFETMLQDQ